MKKGHEGQAVVSETSSGSGSGADSVGTRDYGKQPLVCAGCGASGCSRQCRRCNDLLCQDCINGYDICFMCAVATTSASSGPVCAHSMDAEEGGAQDHGGPIVDNWICDECDFGTHSLQILNSHRARVHGCFGFRYIPLSEGV